MAVGPQFLETKRKIFLKDAETVIDNAIKNHDGNGDITISTSLFKNANQCEIINIYKKAGWKYVILTDKFLILSNKLDECT